MGNNPKKLGTFTISLDTESIWGIYYGGRSDYYIDHLEKWRENIKRLIILLEKYNIKATWAFVGHLFLDQCQKVNNIPHPDILDLGYKEKIKNWRLFDPCTDIIKNPFWYGKDVLNFVKGIRPKQEIATHTFFHTKATDPKCTEQVFRSEIEKCLEVAGEEKVHIKSIVFPSNQIAHLSVLKDFGINNFRDLENSFFRNWPYPLQRPFMFFQHFLSLTPSTYNLNELKKKEGALAIPVSLFFINYNFVIKRFIIPGNSRSRRAIKGINSAIKNGELFHMWFHPIDLGSSEKMFENLEKVFSFVDKKIREGELINLTMEEIGDRYGKSE